ncbi:hypothetical protein [Streptomyces lydicus]|uniref:hypothetical protein n=1 Tax=Streptomyces lydicus TaxID=47763 RepID=UPI0039A5D14A
MFRCAPAATRPSARQGHPLPLAAREAAHRPAGQGAHAQPLGRVPRFGEVTGARQQLPRKQQEAADGRPLPAPHVPQPHRETAHTVPLPSLKGT